MTRKTGQLYAWKPNAMGSATIRPSNSAGLLQSTVLGESGAKVGLAHEGLCQREGRGSGRAALVSEESFQLESRRALNAWFETGRHGLRHRYYGLCHWTYQQPIFMMRL